MFNARLILVFLISACPFILLMDGAVTNGIVAGLAAAGIAVVSRTMWPGEARFLISIVRRGMAFAAVPALWIVIQILPLRALANPIWSSAESAVGYPLAGSISIDIGASVMALGLYLSACAVTLLSAAVAVDRQRAVWILSALVGATTLIALMLIAGLAGPNAPGEAQAIDCTAFGTIVAAAAAIRILEQNDSQRANPRGANAALFRNFAACGAAFAICAVALGFNLTGAPIIAAGYGLAAVLAVAVIRRLGLGPWGVAAMAVPAIGLAILLIASEPGARTKGVSVAFAVPSSTALISASQRVLNDTAWTGTGAGTFTAIAPIYRAVDEPAISTPPTAVAALSIELGRPMTFLIVAVMIGTILTLFRASLLRGRDSFYPAAGSGCLIATLFLSFMNPGTLGTAAALIIATVIGLALAQSKSRTI